MCVHDVDHDDNEEDDHDNDDHDYNDVIPLSRQFVCAVSLSFSTFRQVRSQPLPSALQPAPQPAPDPDLLLHLALSAALPLGHRPLPHLRLRAHVHLPRLLGAHPPAPPLAGQPGHNRPLGQTLAQGDTCKSTEPTSDRMER